MTEKIFPKGMFFKRKRDNAPDFVKGHISIKKDEFAQFMQTQEGEYINLDLLVSREGKPYLSVNTWKPSGDVPAGKTQSVEDEWESLGTKDENPY